MPNDLRLTKIVGNFFVAVGLEPRQEVLSIMEYRGQILIFTKNGDIYRLELNPELVDGKF